MNLTGICSASGLADEDKAVLEQLMDVHDGVQARNALLEDYYEGEQRTPSIGIDNIPDTVDPGVRCDWARKAVTSVSERVRLDGFVFDGGYEDAALSSVLNANDLNGAFNRTVASELTHGCMFATVNRVGERTAVRMHSAETGVAIWDAAEQRIGAGLVVADAKRTDWGGLKPVPVQVNLHLPRRVVVLRRESSAQWSAETLPHPLERPLMEAFSFRPTGTKPFGQTRITRTVRYLVDEVERTLRYMAVSSAIYAVPMIAALGLTDEQFDAMAESKWMLRVGSWFLSTRDENGEHPDLQQFSGASPQPYVEAIQTYAKLFSGATGVPLNSLGIVQDNPSSAEAIAASRDDVCVAAEDCIESNRESMRNVALMAMAVASNTTIDGLTDQQKSVTPNFKDPTMPSLAATADAATKIAGVVPEFAQSAVFWEMLGFSEDRKSRVMSDVRRSRASSAIASLIAPREEDAGGADSAQAASRADGGA